MVKSLLKIIKAMIINKMSKKKNSNINLSKPITIVHAFHNIPHNEFGILYLFLHVSKQLPFHK